MHFGIIQDKKLILSSDRRQYGGDVEKVVRTTELSEGKTMEKVTEAKPIRFAPIPDFDQLTQAVYQSDPIDRGDYIEAGIYVVDVPKEKDDKQLIR